MKFNLTTESIQSAYHELASQQFDNSSILHIFFILKACGFSRDRYLSVGSISNLGYPAAHAISSLFSPWEIHPQKYDFISPFSMAAWESQSPSEPLKKWVGGRIKNNVIGGATTWRKLVDDDPDEGSLKFKYDYVNQLASLTLKSERINLCALSIWAYRFNTFDKKMSLIELTELFKTEFKLSESEIRRLFKTSSQGLTLTFEDQLHDASAIRQLIGVPKGQSSDWIRSRTGQVHGTDPRILRENEIFKLVARQVDMKDVIQELLNKNSQIILAGPPGTSKSFYARTLTEDIFKPENVVSIQFHPKYSYQDFIGGYVVNGRDVEYADGVLYEFVQKAHRDPDKQFLLIIDEINRANVGQVFGETIQCLDRDYQINLLRNQALENFSIPKNLKIIGTMNTSDRSLGVMDFAIKRRFPTIYCPPLPDLVTELCISQSRVMLGDFLRKLNNRLLETLKNRELSIGHAFFMGSSKEEGHFFWSDHDLEMLFNYQILPLIEDYTKGNTAQLMEVLGAELASRLTGDEFITAMQNYTIDAN